MSDSFSTGQAAAILGVTEPQLNDLVRRGKINPVPVVASGRRRWSIEHVRQAAAFWGIPADLIRTPAVTDESSTETKS